MPSKQSRFTDLVTSAQNCSLCPRMKDRKRVLGPANGSLDSAVVFIAEAPGRLGADKYGIPLYGDQTGKNFDKLLAVSGMTRNSVFITNVVLCNPRDNEGNNSTPTQIEIRNCVPFLLETIEIIQPKIIVTLGTKALTALHSIQSHEIKLATCVGRLFAWRSYHVCPLYHPGSRVYVWRNKAKQEDDFIALMSSLKTMGVQQA